MPGIPSTSMANFANISPLSALSLPETTLSFWLYISSPSLQHSLQTVLSTVSIPTKRFTVSSIMTSFAQWQHVLGSIASSGDADAINYFENFLLDELNLTAAKIERRRASLRDAMIESLTALVIEHTSDTKTKGWTKGSCGKYVHPAVKEAKQLLREMAEEDESSELDIMRDMKTMTVEAYSASMSSLVANSLTFFLDVEEYVLRSEFTAFKKDSVGPNGRGYYDSKKLSAPALIRYLRVYHDGLLSVDSKQAYSTQTAAAVTPSPKASKRQSRRLSSTASCQSSNMSYLEKQFLEAMSASTPVLSAVNVNVNVSEQRRGSVASTYSIYAQYVEKEKENELRRQRTREIREPKFWDGDWDHEDEFYREALRYDLR